jgi:cytochrome c553
MRLARDDKDTAADTSTALRALLLLALVGPLTAVGGCKVGGDGTARYKSSGKGVAGGSNADGVADATAATGQVQGDGGVPISTATGVTTTQPSGTVTGAGGGGAGGNDPGDDGSPFADILDVQGPAGPGAFAPSFRTSPDFFTLMTATAEGAGPHGRLRIWYSSNVRDVVGRPTFTVPEGTVAIAAYVDATRSGHAVMVKKAAGFDAAANDWSYELRGEDGALLPDPPAGKNATCSGCHAAAQAKDYLAGTELRAEGGDVATATSTGTGTGTGAGTGTGTGTATGGGGEPGPGKFIPDFARTTEFFTEMPVAMLGRSPHGRVRVWYSANVKDMLANATLQAPVGTVAIKEFDNDGQPGVDGIAVMIKKPAGYDPARHDWYFEMRDEWGVLEATPAAGKIAACSACHAAAQATDYLSATKLGREGQGGGDGPGKFVANYYESAQFFTEMAAMGPDEGPHGSTRIWYSANLRQLARSDDFVAPNGSVAIARWSHGPGTTDMGVVVMIKEAGFDPAHGDWRYETRDRYGNLKWDPRPGAVPECVACHAPKTRTDRLQGTKLRN